MTIKVKDSVCGMTMDVNDSTPHLNYEGKDYYFCAIHCLKDFEKDPTKYLGNSLDSGQVSSESIKESEHECCHNHGDKKDGCCHEHGEKERHGHECCHDHKDDNGHSHKYSHAHHCHK